MRKRTLAVATILASGFFTKAEPLRITCEAKDGKATIRLVGDISDWQNSAADFESKVDALIASGVRDAHVYIRTRGGDVFEANEIVNAIKRFPGILTGSGGARVASAGTMIAMNLPTFEMASNGMFMYHKPSGGFEGNEDQVESSLGLLKKLTAQYRTLYATKTGLAEDEVEKRWAKADVWLTAQEALDQKFITGITDADVLTDDDVKQMAAMGAPQDKLKIAALAAPKNNDDMDIKALRVTLGMPETATETEVLAKVKQLQDNTAAAVAAAATARANEVKGLIDAAVTQKKITEAHRKGFEVMFAADFAATKAQLEAIEPVATMSAVPGASTGEAGTQAKGRDAWKYEDWAMKDEAGLLAMMKSNPEQFSALYEDRYGKKPNQPKA